MSISSHLAADKWRAVVVVVVSSSHSRRAMHPLYRQTVPHRRQLMVSRIFVRGISSPYYIDRVRYVNYCMNPGIDEDREYHSSRCRNCTVSSPRNVDRFDNTWMLLSSSSSTIDNSVGEWPILNIVTIIRWCCSSSFEISDSRRAYDVKESSASCRRHSTTIASSRLIVVIVVIASLLFAHEDRESTDGPQRARLPLCCTLTSGWYS